MNYYITKYALTSTGVYILADCEDNENGIIEDGPISRHKIGKDAFPTPEAAIDRVQEMKANKLKSLEKQIKKISALDPEAVVKQAKVINE